MAFHDTAVINLNLELTEIRPVDVRAVALALGGAEPTADDEGLVGTAVLVFTSVLVEMEELVATSVLAVTEGLVAMAVSADTAVGADMVESLVTAVTVDITVLVAPVVSL